MLSITVPETELFIEDTNEFAVIKEQTLSLEHSLVSISKWEQKWNIPFLEGEKTLEQSRDYIRCMTLTQNVNPLVYYCLTNENIEAINKYIEAPMTATWFRKEKKTTKKEIITNERIYYWMITLNIPFECQKWHLNRLLTLIRVCMVENAPKKKRNKKEMLEERNRLNELRKKQYNTKG